MLQAELDNGEIIIGDHTPADHPDVAGGMRGLINRDPVAQKVGYSAAIPPAQMKVYTDAELAEIVADREKYKSRLSDILRRGNKGGMIPSLDQNGQGYCWFYGTAGALTAARAKMGLPYVRLSPHWGALNVKKGRDEGGWGALSLEFLVTNGCCDVDHWPEQSMARGWDAPALKENAKLYMPNSMYVDLASAVYDRDLSFAQQMTCLADLNPTSDDYDYWGHCVGGVDVVLGAMMRSMTRCRTSGKVLSLAEFDAVWGMNHPVTGGKAKRIRNSWGMTYGDAGFAVMTGSKAIANNCVAIIDAIPV